MKRGEKRVEKRGEKKGGKKGGKRGGKRKEKKGGEKREGFIGSTDVKNTVCIWLKFCPPDVLNVLEEIVWN